MKHLLSSISFFTLFMFCLNNGSANAQAGNVGIGTTTPGSKLTVNGSFAAAYNAVTTTTYAAGENDFYVVWNGTAAGTITLPVSSSGPDRTGRLYFFKNTSAVYTLTIDAAGTELIDNNQTLVLEPGEAALMVKTNVNTATGITYELVQVSKTESAYMYSVSSNTEETHSQGTVYRANFTSIDYSTNGGGNFNLGNDTWTCPQTGFYRIEFFESGYMTTVNVSSHSSIRILRNGASVSTQYYTMTNGAAAEVRNGGYNTIVVRLVQNDQISAQKQMCNGCGATNMISFHRRMIITRL